MAEEQKSRLTSIVTMITAVSGMVAALVAASVALKSHLAGEPRNATAAITTNAMAPANAAGAMPSTGEKQVAGGLAARPDAGPARPGSATRTIYVDRGGQSGSTSSDTPAEGAPTVQPAPHRAEPETPATDDSTHESE